MLPTEKQLTANASENAIEEVYTNHDISIQQTTYDPLTGYPYQYPVRWLNDPSEGKRIGLRSIEVIPPAMMFTITLTVKDTLGKEEGETKTYLFDVTSSNTLKEILNLMSNILLIQIYDPPGSTKPIRFYQLKYTFDTQNKLVLYVVNDGGKKVDFKIESVVPNTFDDIINLLKFLNQDVPEKVISDGQKILTSYSESKTFTNVWDRENLFVHASFCTTNRHYLGKNNESHDSPNKLYPGPTNDSTFYLRFTSNHITNLLPRHTIYTIELSFILNYKKSIVI